MNLIRILRNGRPQAALVALWIVAFSGEAFGHDLRPTLEQIQEGVIRVYGTLSHLRASPVLPPPPVSRNDHRRVLGSAEIELSMGRQKKALELLIGRLTDPAFRVMPEYVDTLLLTSQILEDKAEVFGAMTYARRVLDAPTSTPEQAAEAGARWFRLARRHQRMADRLAVFELWKKRGGFDAADVEVRSAAAYEAAFALKEGGRIREAQQLLSTVPSDTAYGSRAAYVAGAFFVEAGDLENAERWFSAIMAWPLPQLDANDPQAKIEKEVRHLAALSAGRLRFERGDANGAIEAYRLVPDDSIYKSDACFEMAHLAVERRKQRGALSQLRCVYDLGASGGRHVDARLMKASLFAHLARYEEAFEVYQYTHARFLRERDIVERAVASIEAPADFLFRGMERNAVTQGRHATPGPATVFGDAWTPAVDRGYRIDRDVDHVQNQLELLLTEVDHLIAVVSAPDAFSPILLRRRYLHRLLRDVQHLQGHAADVLMKLQQQASVGPPGHGVSEDKVLSVQLMNALDAYSKAVESDLIALDREEASRRKEALQVLGELRNELRALLGAAHQVDVDGKPTIDAVAREALGGVVKSLDAAAMRAEVGALDTYWVMKEHVSEGIRDLARERDEIDREFQDAVQELRD